MYLSSVLCSSIYIQCRMHDTCIVLVVMHSPTQHANVLPAETNKYTQVWSSVQH